MRSMVELFNIFHETRSQLFSWTVHLRLQLGLYYLFHEMRKWLLSQLYNICLTLFRLGEYQIDTCLPFSPYLRHGFCSESEQTYRNRVKILLCCLCQNNDDTWMQIQDFNLCLLYLRQSWCWDFKNWSIDSRGNCTFKYRGYCVLPNANSVVDDW